MHKGGYLQNPVAPWRVGDTEQFLPRSVVERLENAMPERAQRSPVANREICITIPLEGVDE